MKRQRASQRNEIHRQLHQNRIRSRQHRTMRMQWDEIEAEIRSGAPNSTIMENFNLDYDLVKLCRERVTEINRARDSISEINFRIGK